MIDSDFQDGISHPAAKPLLGSPAAKAVVEATGGEAAGMGLDDPFVPNSEWSIPQ